MKSKPYEDLNQDVFDRSQCMLQYHCILLSNITITILKKTKLYFPFHSKWLSQNTIYHRLYPRDKIQEMRKQA